MNKTNIGPEARELLKENTANVYAYGYSYAFARHEHINESLINLRKVLESDLPQRERLDYALSETENLISVFELLKEYHKELNELLDAHHKNNI